MSSVSSRWVHSLTGIPHIPSVEQQQDQGEKSLRHKQIMVICQVHYMFLDTMEIIGVDLSPADMENHLKFTIIPFISGLDWLSQLMKSWNGQLIDK